MRIVRRSVEKIHERGRIDRARVARTTDREVAAQIAGDPDTAPTGRLRGWRKAFNPPVPDVTKIRRRLGLSQSEFAARFGFSLRTIQQWEQGRATPDRPARILLRVIERTPEAVDLALA